ncbi:MAG: hypothetical protein M1822_002505 [Bathelium mastoideum]|nr:MAG: hypothetical protein M1822_002505 [Bathelium mastoideum]
MPRTMQLFKELGLYDIMREESLKYYDEHTCVITVESLAGKLIHKWMDDVNDGIEEISATRRVFLTQQVMEPILRAKALELGANLRFSTELTDFSQDSDGVTAIVHDKAAGTYRKIRAKYMVAADGFNSRVRNKLGIPTRGPGLLSRALTIYFQITDKKALAKLPNAHYSGVIYATNKVVRSIFRFDRDKKESFLLINEAGEQGTEASRFPADTMNMEKAKEYLRAAIGADIGFEIFQLNTWEAIADLPDRFCEGRIVLAGDAAHRMPPNGGYGGNTGVQDAHNLGWKLAYTLQGMADESLVTDTYEAERRPVAKQTIEQATAHYVHRTAPERHHLIEEHGIREVEPDVDLELAYRYHSNALYTKEGDPLTEHIYSAVARSGSIAHHVMVDTPDAKGIPIADFLGEGFVLFVGPGDVCWRFAMEDVNASKTGFPKVHVQYLVYGQDSPFAARYGVDSSGAVLVRPDGIVAWSSITCPDDITKAQKTLVEVMSKVVGRKLRC